MTPAQRKSKRTHSRQCLLKLALTTLAIGLVGTACSKGDVNAPHEEVDYLVIQRSLEFRHPFANIPLEDGQVPIVEAKNSSDGRRFALQDRAGAEATMGTHDSALVKLTRRPMTSVERDALHAEKFIESAGRAHNPPRPVVDPRLEVALAERPHQAVMVLIRVDEPERIDIQAELNRAVALGEIST